MKNFVLQKVSRRKFTEIMERLWLALFLVPPGAKAACCSNVYVDCTAWTTGDCWGPYTSGFFAADDFNEPLCYPQLEGGCAWCSTDAGCIACDQYYVTCTGICCGSLEYFYGNTCCEDTTCCPR